MTTYVVGTRRERLGGKTAAEVVAQLPGVRIKRAANPDLVLIETSDQADELQSKVGTDYYVEPEIIYTVC